MTLFKVLAHIKELSLVIFITSTFIFIFLLSVLRLVFSFRFPYGLRMMGAVANPVIKEERDIKKAL